jgi:hypothetical protein
MTSPDPEVRWSVRAELPCQGAKNGWHGWQACKAMSDIGRRCGGCLSDGTRVDLSNGQRVVRQEVVFLERGAMRHRDYWLPVEASDTKPEVKP